MTTVYIFKDPNNSGKVAGKIGQWPVADATDADYTNTDLEAISSAQAIDDVLVLAAGSYGTTELDATGGFLFREAGQTLRGPESTDPLYVLYQGVVTVDGTGVGADTIGALGVAGCHIKKLTVTGSDTDKYNVSFETAGEASTIDQCIISGGSRSLKCVGQDVVIWRTLIGSHTHNYPCLITGATSPSFNYCWFNGPIPGNGAILQQSDAGEKTTLNNCLICNCVQLMSLAINDNLVDLNNCIFFNCGNETSGGVLELSKHIVRDSTPTGNGITANRCVLYNPARDASAGRCLTSDNGAVTINTALEEWPKFVSNRRPARLVCMIDDYENYAHAKDVMDLADTYNIPVSFAVETSSPTGADWAEMQGYIDNGHEMSAHAASVGDLTALTAEQLTTELLLAYSEITANTTQDYYTLTPPQGLSDASVKAEALAQGFYGSRIAFGSGTYQFADIDTFGIANIGCAVNVGTTTADIKNNTLSVISHVVEVGGVWVFQAHSAAEFSLTNWEEVFKGIQASGVPAVTLGDAINFAKTYDPSGDLATIDNMTYSRTMVDSENYHLNESSELINAGKIVSAIYGEADYFDDPMYDKHNVGISEKAGTPKRRGGGFLMLPGGFFG